MRHQLKRFFRLRLIIAGCGLMLTVGSSACVSPKSESILPAWRVVGPSVGLVVGGPLPEDSPYFSRAQNVIMLEGAVNETLAFQLALSATEGQAAGVVLAAEDFTGAAGTIPRDAVRMYRAWPITVERYPNWYLRSQGLRQRREILDVLVPIDAPRHGQPFVIAAGSRLIVWVEIKVPADAAPGTYHGAVIMLDADGNKARTPVEMVVRDIYLSPNDAIPVLAGVQLGPIITAHTTLDPLNLRLVLADQDARRTLLEAFAILHQHGLSPYTDEIRPLFRQDQTGGVLLDWTDYEAFCGPLIDGGAYPDGRRAHAWPIPVDLRQPDPGRYGGIQSAVYAAVMKEYLAQAKEYFEEKGRLDQAFVRFDLPKRRNHQAEALGLVRQLATITHLVDQRLAFASDLIPQPMSAFGWFDHYFEDLSGQIDIWSTPARYQHPPTLGRLQRLGSRTWLLPDRPPFSGSMAVEAPPLQARSLAWQAFLQGHQAVVLPQATDWPDDVLARPIRDRAQPSDTWLLYPGTPFGLKGPVPSVRLKQLQLGIQDNQYLRLLEAHGRGGTARLLAGSLIKAAGTDAYGDNYQDGLFDRRIEDVQTWELARKIMIDEVAEALTESMASGYDQAASQADWAKFLAATRRIDLRAESARLQVDQRTGQSGFLVAYEVALRNELRTPLRGELCFGPLAPEARSVSDPLRLGPIPEMGLVRQRLIASMPSSPPVDLDGHHTQVVIFDGGTSGRVATRATLSIVQVPRAPIPIVVDGDLSDWPPNEFNVAGDFRLINTQLAGPKSPGAALSLQRAEPSTAGTGLEGPPAAETFPAERPRAESQTVAYFCQDAGMLYIGIHAAVPEGAGGGPEVRPLRNFVEYQDLMPVGEDLVEVLIDPGAAGTQSDDLYHIVLKATGNPIFERGVGTVPPIGRRRPWPGDQPVCCVAPTEYGWCAEIAIPIASFGPAAGKSRIWGINLARLEPHRGEYSDWSRAPRFCYDPRTLGNLLWPE